MTELSFPFFMIGMAFGIFGMFFYYSDKRSKMFTAAQMEIKYGIYIWNLVLASCCLVVAILLEVF